MARQTARTQPLLPEWRGALFRVRLARLRALERSAVPIGSDGGAEPEPPRFDMAYLSNPQPTFPAMSRKGISLKGRVGSKGGGTEGSASPSAAPVTARHRNVRRNEPDNPNTIVAAPYAHTAHSNTTPRRSIRSIDRTITTLISTAPTDGAAYSHPYPLAPTRRMSCAKIGRSAVADGSAEAKGSLTDAKRRSSSR